jgi:hypothetical protein
MTESGRDPAFDFTSRWQLSTGLEAVWDALVDYRTWPEWWPGLQDVETIAEGDADGIGQRANSHWRGPVGYQIEFEIETIAREHLKSLEGRATGDLTGSGAWHISPVADLEQPDPGSRRLFSARERGDRRQDPDLVVWTQIVFGWHVVATKKWMRLINPVARPFFVHGHDHVMKEGAHGLAGHLKCEIRNFATGEDAKS